MGWVGAGGAVGAEMGLRKAFFFDKEKQKTSGRLSRTYPAAYAKWQKFFGSFFQERTSLPL
jgi:hypothetical protein